MRFLCAVLVCVLGSGFISCRNKPAYSDLDTSREAKNANKSGSPPEAAATGAVADQPVPPQAPGPEGQPPAAAQSQSFKPPKFMVNGQAKDLPNYPQAFTRNIQYGPVQGVDTMSLVLESNDSIEKIIAFYENAIKKNGWTVDTKSVNPEQAEWNLKKTFDNEGKVQVIRNPQSNAVNIILVRTEKIAP